MRASVVGAGLLLGCGGPARFAPDELLRATSGIDAGQAAAIDRVLAEWFGTPDEPRLPEGLPRLSDFLRQEDLAQAAGRVESHEVGVTHGLYRRHCARCHGLTGDGRGPAALYQDPYPRDFRRGVFKWKSTRRDAPPTDADLQAVLERGVPGTAMPSFRLLGLVERDILRQYVQYLAIRGTAERELVRFTAEELSPGESIDWSDQPMREELLSRVSEHVDAWADSAEAIVWPSGEGPAASASDEAIALGRELYHGERAGCAKCHGREGRGGAVAGRDFEVDYDEWSRDRVIENPSPGVAGALSKQLKPRTVRPRRLVGQASRGADTPLDRFRRLHQGIAGTPMPALGPRREGEGATLGDQEIAAIVEYVDTLSPERGETPRQEGEARQ